jgi:hypothetical protein
MTTIDTTDTPAPPPPAPVSAGRYALFETPGGGRHLVYHPDGGPDGIEGDQHIDIPGFIVSMAEKAASGEGIAPGMLGRLLGGGQGEGL